MFQFLKNWLLWRAEIQEFKKYRSSQLLPPYQLGKPVQKDWNLQNSIEYGYKNSTWVYSCVNAISKAAASVPWKVYQTSADGTRKPLPQHPLELLILKPNPFMSRKDLIERMTQHLYLGGDSFNTKVRDSRGIVAELWALHPDFVRVVPHKTDFIAHYEYKNQGVNTNIDVKDMLHNMFIDPGNPYTGLAPLKAAAQVIDTDTAAVLWNRSSLENRAVTDGIFSFEQPLTKTQWEAARDEVRTQHQGANNARTPWVLSGGAKYTPMSLSPAEMDFIESRKLTREEICAIFQVPPPIVGILDKANYSNIETARRIFWQDTIKPYLEDLKNCFNSGLAYEFGNNIELDYDLSVIEAVQENFNEKIENARALWSMGVPFNLINDRLQLGFDAVEGGDVGYLPAALLPASQAGAMPAAVPPQEDEKRQPLPRETKALNLSSEEQKELYWKAFDGSRNSWITAFFNRAAQVFEQQGEAVAKAFEEGGDEAAAAVITEGAKQWERLFVAEWQAMTRHFVEQTYNQIKGHQPQENKLFRWFWDALEEAIQTYILRTTASKVKHVTDTTKDAIMQLLYNMRTQGDAPATTSQITNALREQFKDFSTYRAWRIARTEVVAASNYSSHETASNLEEVTYKEWITSYDDRVRDSHKVMHRQKVEMHKMFSNGLMFPGDYENGSGHDNINCRCAIVYHTE